MAAWNFIASTEMLKAVERKVWIGLLYPGHTYTEMINFLGCSKACVEQIAHANGFKKAIGYTNPGGFKKGLVPANKGKKMVFIHPNSRRSQFQKGHLPKNAKPVGCITFRPGKGKGKSIPAGWFIKKAEPNIWKALSHHIWEMHNNPVPKGYVLRFIDGDYNNCSIENLEVITMKENRVRNSASTLLSDRWVAFTIATKKNQELTEELVNNYPELIQLKRLQITLKRQINGHLQQA